MNASMPETGPVPPGSDWFPVRITSVLGGGAYLFVEVWATTGGVVADKIGGRINSATSPAYAIDGSTFAATVAGSAVQVNARMAPGSGGVQWELEGVGGASGPDASLTVRGWVSTGSQYFGGFKTIPSGIGVGPAVTGHTSAITFDSSGLTFYSALGAVNAYYIDNTIGVPSNLTIFGISGTTPGIQLLSGAGSFNGMTTNVVVGASTLHFTSGLLTSIT